MAETSPFQSRFGWPPDDSSLSGGSASHNGELRCTPGRSHERGRNTIDPIPRLRVLATRSTKTADGNPYLELLETSLAQVGVDVVAFTPKTLVLGSWDIWHLHWPELFYQDLHIRGVAKFAMYILIAKLRKRPIVWTCHNVGPHDTVETAWGRSIRWFWLRCLAGSLHLSGGVLDVALRELPELALKPHAVTAHGHYRWYYGPRVPAETEPKITTIGWLGRMRPYKGLDSLVSAFVQTESATLRLLIAGEADKDDLAEAAMSYRAMDDRISVKIGLIPRPEMASLLGRLDIGVLPYRKIHNSGTAILMLSYGVRILVPDLPVFRDLRSLAGSEWVHIYRDDLTARHLEEVALMAPPDEPWPDLDELEWPEIAMKTMDFYRRVRAPRDDCRALDGGT